MNIKVKTLFVSGFILVVLLVSSVIAFAQEPTASPSPTTPTAEKVKNDAQEPAAAAAAAKPAPTPEPDFWHQEEMTGDWGGDRSKMKEKGVVVEFSLSNFYQGIASGGLDTRAEYNALFSNTWKFDLGKLLGWKWWS